MVSAEPKRQVGFQYRFRLHGDILEVPVAALKTCLWFGPEKLDDLYRFAEARHAVLACITENILVRSEMTAAKPHTHDSTSPAHAVERRVSLCQLHWIAQGQENYRGTETQLRRNRRHIA